MHHLLTVMILIMIATLVTGIILPLTTPDRRHARTGHAGNGWADDDGHDAVAAAELAVSG